MEYEKTSNQVTVEVRNSRGDVVRQYEASSAEIKAAPLLLEARQFIKEGKPQQALGRVLDAVRQTRGQAGVWEVLEDARHAYANLDAESDEPVSPAPISEPASVTASTSSGAPSTPDMPFLVTQGKEDIIRDAYMDGSSTICPLCKGLISLKRLAAHQTRWCPVLSK